MAINWTPIAAAVKGALELTGRTATLRIPALADSGRPHDPTAGTPTDVTITITEDSRSVTNRNESVVQAGDKVFLVAPPAGQNIDTSMAIIDGGDTYQLVDVSLTNPGDTKLLYTVLARK